MRAWTWVAVWLGCVAVGCGGDDNGNGTAGVGGAAATGAAGGAVAGTTGGTGGPCDAYAGSGAARGTRADVELILRGDGTATNMFGSCGFSTCHTGANPPGGFDATADLSTTLVGVPSCQAAGMTRVVPGDPAMSWLWTKLTGPFDADGNVASSATPQSCTQTPPGTLGASMPWTGSAPIALADSALYQICTWIEDGAP